MLLKSNSERRAANFSSRAALVAPDIEKTRDRLEELAKRFGDEEKDEGSVQSETSSESPELARLTQK